MIECYFCGRELLKRDISKDHMPPSCIFPDAKPDNLITVKCCKSCHAEFQILDERMRNYIAIIAGQKSGEVGQKAKNVVLGSPGLVRDFLSHTEEHPTLVDYTGHPRLLFYFTKDELNRWLIRIVKGLHFNRYRERLADGWTFEVTARPEIWLQDSSSFPMEEGLQLRPYFVYGVVEEKEGNFWVLVFYDHVLFTVKTRAPGKT
jgi:hypothetical protein